MRDLTIRRHLHLTDRDERLVFLTRKPAASRHKQRWFSEKDFLLLLRHGILGLTARIAPPAWWPGACRLTSSFLAFRRRRRERAGFSEKVNEVIGLQDPDIISDLQRASYQRLHERHMTYLRERYSRRNFTTEVQGLEHLQQSLQAGSGAILWNTPALGDVIVTKRALASVGMRAHQLSVRSHGFSQSRFAMRRLNPGQHEVENRYLDGRIWFEGEDAIGATRQVMRKLRQNLPVLFTNSLFAGRAFVGVPVGHRLAFILPTTPLSIAVKTGVPLHIITTVEQAPFTHYVTEISSALSIGHDTLAQMDDDEKVANLALLVRDVVLGQLRTYPDQLRLWDRLIAIEQLDQLRPGLCRKI